MNNITYVLFISTESITVTGLKRDTKYTFSINARIEGDIVMGPTSNLTYQTQATGECDSTEECIAQGTVCLYVT